MEFAERRQTAQVQLRQREEEEPTLDPIQKSERWAPSTLGGFFVARNFVGNATITYYAGVDGRTMGITTLHNEEVRFLLPQPDGGLFAVSKNKIFSFDKELVMLNYRREFTLGNGRYFRKAASCTKGGAWLAYRTRSAYPNSFFLPGGHRHRLVRFGNDVQQKVDLGDWSGITHFAPAADGGILVHVHRGAQWHGDLVKVGYDGAVAEPARGWNVKSMAPLRDGRFMLMADSIFNPKLWLLSSDAHKSTELDIGHVACSLLLRQYVHGNSLAPLDWYDDANDTTGEVIMGSRKLLPYSPQGTWPPGLEQLYGGVRTRKAKSVLKQIVPGAAAITNLFGKPQLKFMPE